MLSRDVMNSMAGMALLMGSMELAALAYRYLQSVLMMGFATAGGLTKNLLHRFMANAGLKFYRLQT